MYNIQKSPNSVYLFLVYYIDNILKGILYSGQIQIIMERYQEIAICQPRWIEPIFESLSSDYKILSYYIYRGCIVARNITIDQTHRYAREIIELFEHLYQKVDPVKEPIFHEEIKIFLVYLICNNSQYFVREAFIKKTPQKLEFKELSKEKLVILANITQYNKPIEHILPHIFDGNVDARLVVNHSINSSAVGHYAPGFKDEDYETVPIENRGVNKYYELNMTETSSIPQVRQYSIFDKNAKDMKIAHHWFLKALQFAKDNKNIDKKITEALLRLTTFIATGDEKDLKLFNVAWSYVDGPIDFIFGPFEVYEDPMQVIGIYASEITLPMFDMSLFRKAWPQLERMLPYPPEYQRDIPHAGNITVRAKLFAGGSNGPLRLIAAYCLPNDEHLRQQQAKQVIYEFGPGPSKMRDQDMYRDLTFTKEVIQILKDHDENYVLEGRIWTIHVTLHETVGHAAGKLYKHTFTRNTKIGDHLYKKNDVVDVTPYNIPILIKTDYNALEELRAEINAAWISMVGYHILKDVFEWWKKWDKELGETLFKEMMLMELVNDGIRRLSNLPNNFNEIEGAHARANMVITNYLLHKGGVHIVEEFRIYNQTKYAVLGCKITNMEKVIDSIKELCSMVQSIKATGDGQRCAKLFGWYTKNPITISKANYYSSALKEKRVFMSGAATVVADSFPVLEPIMADNKIKNIKLKWYDNILAAHFAVKALVESPVESPN